MFTRREVHTEMTTRGETRVHTVECTQGGVYAQEEDSNREIHAEGVYMWRRVQMEEYTRRRVHRDESTHRGVYKRGKKSTHRGAVHKKCTHKRKAQTQRIYIICKREVYAEGDIYRFC